MHLNFSGLILPCTEKGNVKTIAYFLRAPAPIGRDHTNIKVEMLHVPKKKHITPKEIKGKTGLTINTSKAHLT
jgi:hypothetical protein